MKTFYIKAHCRQYGSTIHFARLVEAKTKEEAEIIFQETYGWNNRIDIIKEKLSK